jgi:hypothetical protein
MTLQVPIDGFVNAVEHIAGIKEVFVLAHPSGSVVTCAAPTRNVHIVCVCHLKPDQTKERLTSQGLTVNEGIWSEDGQISIEADPLVSAYVAGVSYVSSEHMPGVWIDAYPEQPNHVQVLRAMYDEFRQTGELDEVTFEEFIRLSNPNVVVLSMAELRGFMEAKTKENP